MGRKAGPLHGGRVARWFGAAAFAIALMPVGAQAKRLALVVGNADYDAVADLKNPVSDATAIADALKRLDFEVTLLTDVGGDDFWTQLDTFTKAAETAESTVFYYSGHAFQMSGANYLVPVTAKLENRQALASETWNLDAIVARLQSRNRQTLVFLDACRNDPLPETVRGSAASGGLARMQTGVGTFVAFSTEPGSVAADAVGDADHSPFTSALLKYVETPGISISDMMIEVRNDVEVSTARKQVPWDQSSLRSQFYFVPPKEEGKQELSDADYELLAQLDPEDRKKFLDLLKQSGFDEDSLAEAEAAISVAESNLETVASQSSILGPAEPAVAVAAAAAPASGVDMLASLEVVESKVTLGAAPAAPSVAAEAPGAVAPGQAGEAPQAPAATEGFATAAAPALPGAVQGEDAPTAIAEAIPELAQPAAEPEEGQPIRLAALDYATRDIALNEIAIDRLRLEGRVIEPDTDENRAILAAIDPSLAEEVPALPEIAPAELAMAVQGELKRLGCYQMKVDGSWGKGSRTALTSYFLAKRVVPDSLEPTPALYATLQQDKQVVCAARVASSSVKTGKSAKAVAAQEVKAKATSKTGANGIKGRKADSKKPLETPQKKIQKSAIGLTGSF